MTRFFLFLLTLTATLTLWARAEITFDHTKVDVGNIGANDGAVTFEYPFTNTGDEPLIIISVSNGGCGCTKPKYTLEPVAPGERGKVTVTFDPTGRRGEFNRRITVRSNAGKKKTNLDFSGVVIPSGK